MSFPFQGEQFTFIQPDGTPIKVVGWGDQHQAVFQTLDGYTVVKDGKGFYCYAERGPDGSELVASRVRADARSGAELRLEPGLRALPRRERALPAAAASFRGGGRRCELRWQMRKDTSQRAARARAIASAPPTRGTVGTYSGLCLLIQFPDVEGTISQKEVNDFCNQEGYSGFGNKGSVYDYFLANSQKRFQYKNIVTSYYTAKNPRSYYTDPAVAFGQRARALITEALKALMAQGFDFSKLSADDQGYVYAINVFYAGERINNWSEGLWPHSSSLGSALSLGSGRRAFDYQITDMGTELSLATFCHENGHMVCDFPDFYDYGYESKGVGNYCLMGFGGGNRKNPVNISAYLKYKAGWIGKVTTITDGMELSLLHQGDELLLYSKSSTEYFLIENRTTKDRDENLPSSGLAIWHVDERGSNNNETMSPSSHYECSLEQADGKFDLEKNGNYGDAGDLFSSKTQASFADGTMPNATWWDGSPSGLLLRDISAPGERMTLRVGKGEENKNTPIRKESAPGLKIPDLDYEGISDRIEVEAASADTIGSITVGVQIRHTYRADLRVSLVSPTGTIAMLHDKTGGAADDLRMSFDASTAPDLKELSGEPLAGVYTLKVQDVAPGDVGVLERWTLELTKRAPAEIALTEEPGTRIPDNDAKGITRSLECKEEGKIARLEVSVQITHTYIGDLSVSLISPEGTSVSLHERVGMGQDNLFATYNESSAPELASLAGQSIRGTWQLKVADLAGQDVGKLVRWGVRIQAQ